MGQRSRGMAGAMGGPKRQTGPAARQSPESPRGTFQLEPWRPLKVAEAPGKGAKPRLPPHVAHVHARVPCRCSEACPHQPAHPPASPSTIPGPENLCWAAPGRWAVPSCRGRSGPGGRSLHLTAPHLPHWAAGSSGGGTLRTRQDMGRRVSAGQGCGRSHATCGGQVSSQLAPAWHETKQAACPLKLPSLL